MKNRIQLTVAAFLLIASCACADNLMVLAAASTTDAMREIGTLFSKTGGHTVQFSFASSGALARQIRSGAPADVFLSANERWMDAVAGGGFVDETTRVNLLCNRLVIVVPAGGLPPEYRILNKEPQNEEGKLIQSSTFLVRYSTAPDGRLAVGDIRSVPVGMYAKEALEYSGQFNALRPKLVMASNARSALMFVERGEVDAGIVYATDARISERVEVASVFPEESHSPIRYPAAVCRASKKQALARAFLTFLQSDEAGAIFKNHGFETEQGAVAHESHE